MTESQDNSIAAAALPDRLTSYCVNVEQVVSLGIEHDQYELKRCATIKKESLPDRLDFVKLIQGMANAHSRQERFVVVGADQEGTRFQTVSNQGEFDPAQVYQILAKYLYPVPLIEVFNSLQTSTGEAFVLVVFTSNQPRPVLCISEGSTPNKNHFASGDIWIKKGTSLVRADKSDIDQMYESKIDDEAESRARRRFQHYQEEFGKLGVAPTISPTPARTLLVGPPGQLRLFIEDVIASASPDRFKMLLEMARERMIDSWARIQFRGHEVPDNWSDWHADVLSLYREDFTPAMNSVVALGLEIIKFDAPAEWLAGILNLLVEAFDRPRTFDRLISSTIAERADSLFFAQPAYDAYVGARALATYAVLRSRFGHLAQILRTFVRAFTLDNNAEIYIPLIFWPFSGITGFPEMRNGRNEALWNARIHGAWGSYFGSKENFMPAALQLEFILEINSYAFTSLKEPGISQLKQGTPDRNFNYNPDFWSEPLDQTVPIATFLLNHLQKHANFPSDLAIEPQAFELALRGKGPRERLRFLGGFLGHLRSWQYQASMQHNRFPSFFYWPGELGEAEKEATAASKASRST